MTTEELRRLYERLSFRYDDAVKSHHTAREAFRRERRYVSDAAKAQVILQGIAKQVQQKVHEQIATVVSRCLRAVFGKKAYEFKILFEMKRGKTEARLVFVRNGIERDPVEECGLGAVEVAAFALRLACLMIQKPRKEKVLILDEPFKWVSERRDYRERVGQLLIALSEEMKVQFIIVTHDSVLEVGKVIHIK